MKASTVGYLIIFGVLAILLGVAGYLSNPEKAHTALISGGGFGLLWILWGLLGARGWRASWTAAFITTLVLAVAAGWRASLSWLAVADGHSAKTLAAIIISLMFALAACMLALLLRDHRPRRVQKAA